MTAPFTMLEDALFEQPQYRELSHVDARVLLDIARRVKAVARIGLFGEERLKPIHFGPSDCSFAIGKNTLPRSLERLSEAGYIETQRRAGRRTLITWKWSNLPPSGEGSAHNLPSSGEGRATYPPAGKVEQGASLLEGATFPPGGSDLPSQGDNYPPSGDRPLPVHSKDTTPPTPQAPAETLEGGGEDPLRQIWNAYPAGKRDTWKPETVDRQLEEFRRVLAIAVPQREPDKLRSLREYFQKRGAEVLDLRELPLPGALVQEWQRAHTNGKQPAPQPPPPTLMEALRGMRELEPVLDALEGAPGDCFAVLADFLCDEFRDRIPGALAEKLEGILDGVPVPEDPEACARKISAALHTKQVKGLGRDLGSAIQKRRNITILDSAAKPSNGQKAERVDRILANTQETQTWQ